MPLHFGMPTLIECPTLAESLRLCVDLGLDFVEINMNLPEYQLTQLDGEVVSSLLAETGKYLTIHLDENLNVCDFNPAVAAAYRETVRQTIGLAQKINAPIINMHMAKGVYFTLPDRKIYLFECYIDRYLAGLRDFRDACDRDMAGSGILICIENGGRYHDFQKQGIDLLLESKNFALTYDIGHAHAAGGDNGIEAFILDRPGRLKHMHVHDARGGDCHLALGDGEVDLAGKLALAYEYDCRVVLETKTVAGLGKSAAYVENQAHKSRPAPTECRAAPKSPLPKPIVSNDSPNQEKTALFLSLFRGRGDVYAKRWESKGGQKQGYQPACHNEWVRGKCDKSKVKCSVCEHADFLPLDAQAVVRHIVGQEVIGAYPLLVDESCPFLVIDFDGDGWQGDVAAIRKICESAGIPLAVERSRSGQGAHVWFFFVETVSAHMARKLGSAIISQAMEEHPGLKFQSYDRFFPSQDTMPKGNFGNLIALPLQRKARDAGNSVFVDENFTPYADQWAFLSGVGLLTAADTEGFLSMWARAGELGVLHTPDDEEKTDEPWQKKAASAPLSRTDFPATVRITYANMLYIEKEGISPRALNRLKRLAAFKNPEFFKAQAMRLPTWDKPRIISTYDDSEKYLALPRGLKDELLRMLDELTVSVSVCDGRNSGRTIDVSFNAVLCDEQATALEKLTGFDNGILSATTAFGKTVVAAALIAERKLNTLILVNRRPLLDQWKQRLAEFLTINEELPAVEKKRGRPKESSVIGCFGGGKKNPSGIIDIAIIQSLVRGDEVQEIVKNYGLVIVDECHHVSAVSFERVLKEVNARHVYGLTATPKRQDGHQPIIYMHCGQIRFRDDARLQADKRPFEHFVIPRFTPFRIPIEREEAGLPIQELYNEICQNEMRNSLIVADVLHAVEESRTPLVLTERKAHVGLLAEAIREQFPQVLTFIGGQSAKARKELMEKVDSMPDTEAFVIVATGKYVGEGFDIPRLDTLFLAMPIAWQGTLAQYAGRLHRLHDGKKEVHIYDYVDVRVAVLDRMYAKRVKGYAAIGYKTISGAGLPDTGHIIYDGVNFLPVFTADLSATRHEVLIVSPYVTKARLQKMLVLCGEALAREVRISVVTRPATDYPEKDRYRIAQLLALMKDKGVTLVERARIHQKFAIMDGRTVWYGSINLLSFGHSEESIMRLESKAVAGELLRSVGV